MKTLHLLPLLLPCLGLAVAHGASLQTGDAATAPAVQDTISEAEALFERLSAEYEEAKTKANAEMRRLRAEAREAGKKPVLPDDLFAEQERVMGLLSEAAKTYAGTDGAVPFLLWRVMERPRSQADADQISAALATLEESHIKSPKLKAMLPMMGALGRIVSDEEATAFAAALEEHSSVPELRAMAKYMRLFKELEAAKYGTEAYDKLAEETIAAAKATGEDRPLADAEKAIALASKFSIGMVAPDIEGIDLSGVEFKLSDYDGKVVFLDFWGDW